MQTGAIISGWGHLVVIGFAALSGPIFEEKNENEISVSEVSIVSLSEFDILQKKFISNLDHSETLINESLEQVENPTLDNHIEQENRDIVKDQIDIDTDIAATSTPSIESPQLPEIVNSTPSGFDTNVSVVGEEVALNLEVSEGVKLESPDKNFDIKVDTKSHPESPEEFEESELVSKVTSSELSKLKEELIEDDSAPEQTMTQPIIDALIAELSSAPLLSVRPKGRSLDDAIFQEDPAEQVANNENISSVSNEPVQSARNAPAGPPLTKREKDNLRIAVGKCWNKISLSREALQTTVIVQFSMSEAGYPETESIKLIDYFGGSSIAADFAYNSARRAIIMCGRDKYDLPEEKYSQWKTMEITFDPVKLRIK